MVGVASYVERCCEPAASSTFRGIERAGRDARDAAGVAKGSGGVCPWRARSGWIVPRGPKRDPQPSERSTPALPSRTARAGAALRRIRRKAMKLVDPTIQLVACGSSAHSMATFGYWESEVLERAWDVVDFVSMHA